jgi:hypothetical protein
MSNLERAHRECEYLIVLMGPSPAFDPLRGQPRFEALIEELDHPNKAGARL